MRMLLGGLLSDPARLVTMLQAAVTLALLLALTLRVLADTQPALVPHSRVLTFVIEPLLLAFGIVLFMRLAG